MVSFRFGRRQFLVVLLIVIFIASASVIVISAMDVNARSPIKIDSAGTMQAKHSSELYQNVHTAGRVGREGEYDYVRSKIDYEGQMNVIIVIENDSLQTQVSKNPRLTSSAPSISSVDRVSRTNGFSNQRRLRVINGYSGRLTKEGLKELEDSGVKFRIYEDRIIQIHDDFNFTSEENMTDDINISVNISEISNITDVLNTSDILNVSVNMSVNISDMINISDGNISQVNSPKQDSEILSPESGSSEIPKVQSSEESKVQSSLAVATSVVNANYSWNVLNITGSGVKVALIDTGIDYTHPDLGNCTTAQFLSGNCLRIIGGYDFVNNDADPMDDMYHGTHVAGILGANGTIRGVAPNVTMYALKVCDSGGSCQESRVIAAMDWAKDHSVDIIGLSLGTYMSYDDEGNSGKDPFSLAVDNIVNQGIVVVLSAGNNGPGTSTICAPGAAERAITVGAVNDKNTISIDDDSMWLESSRGPGAFGRLDPELSAPGYDIQSTTIAHSYLELTGTSMASPFVSGAAALLLEKNPSLTPMQVRAILMQSTDVISGKLFERGTGELDIMRALTGEVYALVNHTDTYGRNVLDDRWEFVVTPGYASYANITIYNDNDYNVTFNITLESLTNMENGLTLNTSQYGLALNVAIQNNSNYTLSINFTLSNFSAVYATTYGGVIFFNGTGYDGILNQSKTIRLPVVITVPILNYARLNRTLDTDSIDGSYTNRNPTHEDVYFYAYYSNHSRNVNATISWPQQNWPNMELSLYLYNSTGDFYISSKGRGKTVQSVTTTEADTFKWVRIDGYDFNDTLTFNLSLDEMDNHAPTITAVTDAQGSVYSSDANSHTIEFYRPEDVTINISYVDPDNDSIIFSINDSRYYFVNSSTDQPADGSGLHGYVSYNRSYNSSIPASSTFSVTLTDPYGSIVMHNITILMKTSINISSYSPVNSSLYIPRNGSRPFQLDVMDLEGRTLYFYWSINGTLNSTLQNFTLNTTGYTHNNYTIDLLISNNGSSNATNESLSWNVYIDGAAPNMTVQNPAASSIHTSSRLDINYTVTDSSSGISGDSGIDLCWYNINISGNISYDSQNITLQSCLNTTIYLSNGVYGLYVYSNDTSGNTGHYNMTFFINDSSVPVMFGASPTGDLSSETSSVTLSITTDENASCRYSSSDISYDLMTGIFSDNITSHTAGQGVSSGTAYTFYTRCSDMSNNTDNESSQIAFRISAPSSSGSHSSGSGGGGGGGGGAIVLGPGDADNNGDSVIISNFNSITSQGADINMSSEDAPVERVHIDVNDTFYNVKITITLLNGSQLTLDEIYPQGKVYSYIRIDYENIAPSSIKSIKISFKVPIGWFEENGLSVEGVKLARYDPIYGWKILSTEKITEDFDYRYYDAYSDQMGLFAILHENVTGYTEGPPLEVEKKDKENETEKVSTPQVNSDTASRKGLAAIGGLLKETWDAVNNAEASQWIVIAVFALFVVISMFAFALKHKSLQRYGTDLIKETNKEFKDTQYGFNKIDKLSVKQEANILFKAREEKPAVIRNIQTPYVVTNMRANQAVMPSRPVKTQSQSQGSTAAMMDSRERMAAANLENRRRYMSAAMRSLRMIRKK